MNNIELAQQAALKELEQAGIDPKSGTGLAFQHNVRMFGLMGAQPEPIVGESHAEKKWWQSDNLTPLEIAAVFRGPFN